MKLVVIFFMLVACATHSFALKNVECGLPHSLPGNKFGDVYQNCLMYIPQWSYNSEVNECVKFIYGGCGGNDNRFSSEKECKERCKE
ncbi:hypothetical protein KR044_010426 [Drosophila immigrans]|nr:hypothetical protein KR044_010426 [Drosophila immigrans]